MKISMKSIKNMSSSRKMIFGFIGSTVIGALLLMFPFSLQKDEHISFLTAFFTITSAICVTGLSVVDVSKVFSPVGWTIILIFIQLGGLGVMTFSSTIFLITGKKMTFSERMTLKDERNADGSEEIKVFIKKIFKTVFVIEGIGAVILTYFFINDLHYSFGKALYYGIFHAVSAFCNAGFSLFSTGLEGFAGSVVLNLSIAYLIILGGIGFAVINSFILGIRKGIKKFNLTSKLAILISVFLTFGGMMAIFILEYNNPNTIGKFNFVDKLMAAFFQSVTLRTAGFNTVPLAGLNDGTVFLSYILMFIGASPGSTGGGLKTTTIGVIVFYVLGVVKGRENIELFNRRIGWDILNKALAILVISLMYVGIIIMLILTYDNFGLKEVIYEVISAFATVGVTLGITPNLNVLSQILIITTMFVGRLGPMTFALAIGEKKIKEQYEYPKENIVVG